MTGYDVDLSKYIEKKEFMDKLEGLLAYQQKQITSENVLNNELFRFLEGYIQAIKDIKVLIE